MGLFGKSKKEVKMDEVPSLPSLPELPKLPDFPVVEEEEPSSRISKLPSFPNNSIGKKFSQDTIKDAIAGGEEEYGDADESMDEYDEDKMRMMREPLRKPMSEELGIGGIGGNLPSIIKSEPVFVRLDKFEEALGIFSETKRKLSEVERLLGEAKRLKEKEDVELAAWEREIRNMKAQIEKVDRDVFSKV